MDKEKFVKIIESIKKVNKFQDELYDLHYKYGLNAPDINTLQDELIDVLQMYFDNGGDIEYFIYDMEFGKKYEPGMVTEADGTEIDYSTPEKLYDYLMKHKN